MPISFLNPALLLGSLAAALPVIIHFLSRRRVRREKFSDLRFLAEVQARQARSLGLRRWLLLLLRVLAILCISLAVAGPRWGGLGAYQGIQSVLFVIDTSASMNTGLGSGTRLDEARRVCAQMIGSLPGEAVVQVLSAGSRPEPLFGEWLPAGAAAIGGLAAIEAGEGRFDLPQALQASARLVARAPGSPVNVVLLSDWQDGPDAAELEVAVAQVQRARETHFLIRRIGETTAGGGVLAVELPARAVRPGENITVRARVIPQFVNQVFRLELDGRQIAEAVVEGDPGQPTEVVFPLTVPGIGRHAGHVRQETDAFPGDDRRPFVLVVADEVSVLLVHGTDQPGDGVAGRGGWRLLKTALSPDTGSSLFRTRVVDRQTLTTGALEAADVVFFVDPEPFGRQLWDSTLAWLNRGGQAVFMVGDPKLNNYLADTILPALQLPAKIGYVLVGAPGQHSRIIASDHPVFAGLDRGALQTFEEVSWRGWFRLREGPAQVLVSLTGDDPLVVTTSLGEGRVVLMASDLRPEIGDLAGSPMALPFWQRLAAWLANDTVNGGAITVGQDVELRPRRARGLDRAAALRVLDAEGEFVSTAELFWTQGTPRLRTREVRRAGHYFFMAGDDTLGVVAVALPESESKLELHSAAEISNRLRGNGSVVALDLTGSSGGQLSEALAGRNLAVWFIVAAFLILLGELALGRGTRPAAINRV